MRLMDREQADFRDHLPHVADGLTRAERVVLWVLHQARAEFGERRVPAATLYGRVVEHVNLTPAQFQALLARLSGAGPGSGPSLADPDPQRSRRPPEGGR